MGSHAEKQTSPPIYGPTSCCLVVSLCLSSLSTCLPATRHTVCPCQSPDANRLLRQDGAPSTGLVLGWVVQGWEMLGDT